MSDINFKDLSMTESLARIQEAKKVIKEEQKKPIVKKNPRGLTYHVIRQHQRSVRQHERRVKLYNEDEDYRNEVNKKLKKAQEKRDKKKRKRNGTES